MKKCSKCGKELPDSAVGKSGKIGYYKLIFHEVNRPYSIDWDWKPIYGCKECIEER